MSKAQKSLMIVAWGLGVVAMVSLVASGMLRSTDKHPKEMMALGKVPHFELQDQDGKAFTDQTLQGQVWVCDFVFTRCAGPCPMMTQRMADLQKAVAGANVRLVSFTVDPEHDTPEVLKAYAAKYGADSRRWTLATGKMDEIYKLSEAMKLAAVPATKDSPIIHATYFMLVDRDGTVYGPYHGLDEDGTHRLAEDARRLGGRAN